LELIQETSFPVKKGDPVEYLPVTVDKSHLITIGERLYSESIELIRELVNNAYDADAAEVENILKREAQSPIPISSTSQGSSPRKFP
jgi:hypothetical protein